MPKIALSALFALLFLTADPVAADLSDDQVKKLMIEDSIRRYRGSCPCPYNLAKNGSRCGKRSAWNRGGGASPLCYDTDISNEMVKSYRARLK